MGVRSGEMPRSRSTTIQSARAHQPSPRASWSSVRDYGSLLPERGNRRSKRS